jgi:hypothetical protein
MSLTLLDVLDTAVKIGLGAGITGLATFLIARQNHDRELRKLSFTRRQDSLEQVTEKAEAFFSAWRRYCSTLGGIYSGRHPPDPSFSDGHWKRIRTRDAAFLESRDGMGLAVARLRLLGLTEAADVVNEFNKIVGEFRDQMILQRKTPTHEEFKSCRVGSSDKIKKFYATISSAYRSSGG